jgi:predicted DNA-binding protein with PD1-like motif
MKMSHKVAIIIAVISAIGAVTASVVQTCSTEKKESDSKTSITIEKSKIEGDVVGRDKHTN